MENSTNKKTVNHFSQKIGLPQKSTTMQSLFRDYSLAEAPSHRLYLLITEYLFSKKENKGLHEVIHQSTNTGFVITLVGYRKIIHDFEMQTYRELDYYMLSKKERGKAILIDHLNEVVPEKKKRKRQADFLRSSEELLN